MHVFDNAGAFDVDPLSEFPAESTMIAPQKAPERAIDIGRDLSSSDVITTLFSAMYELQTSVNSLSRELNVTEEILRGLREDVRNAIKVIKDVENRIGALESRCIVRTRPSILATRANTQRVQRSWEWWVTCWRRLLAAAGMMLLTARARTSSTLRPQRAVIERRRMRGS